MTPLTRTRRFGLVAIASFGLLMPALVGSPAQAEELPPDVGDCLMVDDAYSPTSPYAVVDCAETHNSEIYEIAAYPTNMGAPSTLSDEELSAIEDECSFEAFDEWLGAEIYLPLKIWSWLITVPTDDEWADGNRDVLCRTIRPTPEYEALNYRGAIPELFAAGPVLEWLSCSAKTPKSGKDNLTAACTSKSKWLLLGGARVKGKVTSKYPKDLQSAADKACKKLTKRFGNKGTKGTAALLSKRNVSNEWIYTECFIFVKDWNGKVA
ncbi:MAG: septum formation family protein [Candidatus Nanopelagicales bacterium]